MVIVEMKLFSAWTVTNNKPFLLILIDAFRFEDFKILFLYKQKSSIFWTLMLIYLADYVMFFVNSGRGRNEAQVSFS